MRRTLAAATAVFVAAAGALSAPSAASADQPRTPGATAAEHRSDQHGADRHGADQHGADQQRSDDHRSQQQRGWQRLENGSDVGALSRRAPAPTPRTALTTARRVLDGQADAPDPSATIALRDLWLARSSLTGQERREASSMLARPTDGANDPVGFGYTVGEAAPVCSTRICVHYVPSTADAPPSADWVNHTLAVMEQTWTSEVDHLGFRAPLSDGNRGGDGRFDVYLKDLGGDLYGYCAPESGGPGRTARGYCVLDNDFSPAQFPTHTPDGNLRVTAAHEFFHAVQYAYDAGEDRWMMESTATWAEERLANDVNDSRQYLPYGQLYQPHVPLDVFASGGLYQYGNWIFWEYLTGKYGTNFVKKAWKKVGTRKGDGRKYSIQALKKLLRKKGGLTKVYAKFANANFAPARSYPEGGEYAVPQARDSVRLGKRKGARANPRLYHLSSISYRVVPKGSVKRRWKLLVQVDGPARRTSPAVALLIHKTNGRTQQKRVRLDRGGNGRKRVAFDSRNVAAVTVTLANVSSRYRCRRGTLLACNGKSKDDRLRFRLRVRTVR